MIYLGTKASKYIRSTWCVTEKLLQFTSTPVASKSEAKLNCRLERDLSSLARKAIDTDCFRDWLAELGFVRGGGEGGEIFLFHGTKPAILHAVLTEPSAAFTAIAAIGKNYAPAPWIIQLNSSFALT